MRWYRQAEDDSASGMIDLRHVRSISKLEAMQPYAFCVTTDDRNLIVRSSGYTETNNWIKMLHIHADIARGGSGMNIVSDFNETPLGNGCRKASRSRSCFTLQQELDINLRKLQELELSLSGEHPDPKSSVNSTIDAWDGVHVKAKSLSPDRQQSVVETMVGGPTSSIEKRRGGTSRSRCIVDAAQAMDYLSFDSDDDVEKDRCVVQVRRPPRALPPMCSLSLFKDIHPERSSCEDTHVGRDKQQSILQEGGAGNRASELLLLDDVSEELDSAIPGPGRGSRRTERKLPSPDTFMRGMLHTASVDAYADSSDDFTYIADVAEDRSALSLQQPQLREQIRSHSKGIRTHPPAEGHARIKAAWGAM